MPYVAEVAHLVSYFYSRSLVWRLEYLASFYLPFYFKLLRITVRCLLALGPYVRCQTDFEWSSLREEVNKIG
jgi:hypothetical protein